MNSPTIRTLTNEALEAFWRVVAEHFPQAETGDLSPLADITLQTAAEAAVEEWIANNVPQPNETSQAEGAKP